MVNPEHVAAVMAIVGGGAVALPYSVTGLRYLGADSDRRAVMRRGWYIRATWKRTAARIGLVQTDHAAKVGADIPLAGELRRGSDKPRVLIPEIKVRVESWGLRIEVHTIGRIGIGELQAAASYLADTWRVPHVRVEQDRPGIVRVRALLSDPLTKQTAYIPQSNVPVDLDSWPVGTDADGQAVSIRCSGVSGIVVAGLAGYGKTSFINTRFCQLAPSPAVQFVLIDGKGGPDYDDVVCRAWLHCKDELDKAHAVLSKVHRLMELRQSGITAVLQRKNMWHVGPSESWPLVVVIIDEAHTFFNETKTDKARDKVTGELTRMVEELVRKGRNVGIQVILATQKATGDAIPTRIRDNCQAAVSFAQRTSEAAMAALGADISDYPEAHPRKLQHPDYIGVASMVVEGRPGFTLVRTPRTEDEAAEQIARDTASLVADPLALIEFQMRGLHAVEDDAPAA
jgi:DNA segregation ATPase FtsK/SpoIIIE, S-DNA-T family